ncbi:MAG: hypothetical protein QF411_10305 [Planctomycetota bacterium]|nr:hypothetical protein [Planctomycetota bacterium]
MISKHLLPLVFGAALMSSCASTLNSEPWSQIGKGTNSITSSAGWSIYEAELKLHQDPGGSLLPVVDVEAEGTATSHLDPQYGGAVTFSHYISDDVKLGLSLEYRNFDPEPVTPISSELDGDPFGTTHIILGSTYYMDPQGASQRLRPFIGASIGYIPEVPLDATVTYVPGWTEETSLVGDEYWSLGVQVGASYLLRDDVTFDCGLLYETAIEKSKGGTTLNDVPPPFPPGVGMPIEGEVSPSGLIFFFGMTFYF